MNEIMGLLRNRAVQFVTLQVANVKTVTVLVRACSQMSTRT